MTGDGGRKNFNDEDYNVASEVCDQPPSRKLVNRLKDLENNDLETSSIHSSDHLQEATATTSSTSVQRRDSCSWTLETQDYWITGCVLSHIFSTLTGVEGRLGRWYRFVQYRQVGGKEVHPRVPETAWGARS